MADVPPSTGYEPKDLAENDNPCVKLLFFHRHRVKLRLTITAESIATPPPESNLDDEQIRALLASPLYLWERNKCGPITHSVRENLVSSSSQVPKSTGKPVALFSSKRKSSQETFSDREEFSSEHQQVLGNNEPLFRFSIPEKSMKSFFEEHQHYVLADATSEVRKQECRFCS